MRYRVMIFYKPNGIGIPFSEYRGQKFTSLIVKDIMHGKMRYCKGGNVVVGNDGLYYLAS